MLRTLQKLIQLEIKERKWRLIGHTLREQRNRYVFVCKPTGEKRSGKTKKSYHNLTSE
uniref:Uncharacterized protein n=1 Tax=Arion vulgaris TaxID=1028688 RepID=A0A0B6Y232_9EUPU